MSYLDYATPINEPIEKNTSQTSIKKKIQKSNQRVKEPIIYYLDRGTPEPVRSAHRWCLLVEPVSSLWF